LIRVTHGRCSGHRPNMVGIGKATSFLPHDAMHKRGICRHAVSVCLSVTFVSSVETNKYIFKFFSPLGSQAILVFLYQTSWRYSDGNPLNGGVKCRWHRQKSRFCANIWYLRHIFHASLPRNIDWSISRPFPY